MPSPFPGMDPWLEAPDLFPDLHATIIALLRESLNARMPAGYVALGNYLVWTESHDARVPDVAAFGPVTPPGAAHDLRELRGLVAVGTERQQRKVPYLEIRADRGKRLVTVIELLSPSNKVRSGRGRRAYLKKQREVLRADANLVEVDCLRAGAYTSAVPRSRVRKLEPAFDYHISVVVAGSASQFFAAAFRLPDRLPSIGIPLDRGVTPVTVDLQPLLDRAYDTGRYPELVRYDSPPDPPLTAEQAAWAAGILKGKV